VSNADAHHHHTLALAEFLIPLFVTTRSQVRLHAMLDAARRLKRNPQRWLFVGTSLADFLANDSPLFAMCFFDTLGRRTSPIPQRCEDRPAELRATAVRQTQAALA
jgi:hypothetical protein